MKEIATKIQRSSILVCPRCHKQFFNEITINRNGYRVPVNKCKVCGMLWITDIEKRKMNKKELKRLFILDIKNCGKQQ